jgi:hypothetical protein
MKTQLIIGTDEAGYGPNLGPLVITATAWTIPHDLRCDELWGRLSRVLTNNPDRDDSRLYIADSKQVYSPASGLLDLETGVLSCLATLGNLPGTDVELGCLLAGDDYPEMQSQQPDAQISHSEIPVAADGDELSLFTQQLLQEFSATGIRLAAVRSRIVFPSEFNNMVSESGSKGVVLSGCTLSLVRDLCRRFGVGEQSEIGDNPSSTDDSSAAVEGVSVFCDKHGGRNRYDEVISEIFGDQFVFRQEESTSSSRYRMGNIQFCFRTKAEELLPVALASMVSKYLREVLMIRFNEFWRQHVPGLKPTKGYPLDAKRFREQIADQAAALGITENRFWRMR